MKVLFLSAILPYPLYSGGQIRVYNLLKKLSRKHEIHLYTFVRTQHERSYADQLSFCKKVVCVHRGRAWQPGYVLRSIFGPYPFLFATYENKRMSQVLSAALGETSYDLIHIEPGYVWPSLPPTKVPVVVGEHNIEYDVYDQYANAFFLSFVRPWLRLDTRKLRNWVRTVWKKGVSITAVSDEDKEEIARYVNPADVTVIPNGVDVARYAYTPKSYQKDHEVFLFVGNFSWMQNRNAVSYLLKDIWPKLSVLYPAAILDIVGKNIPDSIRSMSVPGVRFRADVSDIREAYKNADIMLAPIRIGGGTKYKILEAMAVGLPVVTTRLGASGLKVTQADELFIADSVQEVVDAVGKLLSDPKKRERLRERARQKIEKEYSWDQIAVALDRVWKKTYERKQD